MIVLVIILTIIGVSLFAALLFTIHERPRATRVPQSEIDASRKELETILQQKSAAEKELQDLVSKFNTTNSSLKEVTNILKSLNEEIDRNKVMAEAQYNERIDLQYEAFTILRNKLAEEFEALKEEENRIYEEWSHDEQCKLEELMRLVDEQNAIYIAAKAQNSEDIRGAALELAVVDINEIRQLMDVCSLLRNPTPLYKAIYEIYYKVPLSNVVSVTGVKGVCGIYKIEDDMGRIYIGQSVDIGERWKQHVKRGCGADVGTISGSKLYSAMMKKGIWSFKFELLQKCGKDDLNRLEKYWIKYFDSVDNGYNMKG